jgi:hypothetical protein
VFFAITDEELSKLKACDGDDARKTFVREEIEDAWDEDFTQEVGTGWEALHRVFGDGTFAPATATTPLSKVVFGGSQLHEDTSWYIINLIEAAEVPEVACALAGVKEDWFNEHYDKLKDSGYKQASEQDKKDVWSWFQGLPAFFGRASQAKRAVIFTVDVY